jgi:hypothetical protein
MRHELFGARSQTSPGLAVSFPRSARFPGMPKPASSRCRPTGVWVSFIAVACGLATVAATPNAGATYARPPEPSPYEPHEPYLPQQEEPRSCDGDWPPPDSVGSTARFHVGPSVLLKPSGPGLFTAIDVGRRAVGARFSGSWLRAESDQGLSAYTAELWIDFRHRYDLHPILGAGASFMHGGAVGDDENAGAGVLRGTLEYELPIDDADARLGLNLLAMVPAIGTERTRPWFTAALTVGAGF